MNEKYKKIIKWVVGITIGVTALILLIVFIKPSSSLPPGTVNCCIKGQCHQLKTADCAKQGGVSNCYTCSSGSGVNCGDTMLSCTTDNDCHNCQEFHQGVQMSCVQPQGSSGGKVCAPTKAKQECKTEYGGINVWSEWDNPDRMEWDCLCGAGNYAAGAIPDGNTVCNINPDICQKGTFTWDVSKKTNPDAGYCFCPSGTVMYTQISGGYPICIPTDGLTEMMYTDLYVKDGRSCPNLCGRRGICGKDSKCVCEMGWGGGVGDCNGQSAIKDFGTTHGAIALTSNAALGLHVTPGQAITLDMPTPVNIAASPDDFRTSNLFFMTNNAIYHLTIDERTGYILPSTDDHSMEWSLSLSSTTGYLVGKKDYAYYFATGPENAQKGSVITMKEQSTLTSADNILSFTTAACTPTTCTDGITSVGLCTPGITWFNSVLGFRVDNKCTIVNTLMADGSVKEVGTLKVTGDKGVITVTMPGTGMKTLSSDNVNTSVINWVSDTGDKQQWTIIE